MKNVIAEIASSRELASDLVETIEMLEEDFKGASFMMMDSDGYARLLTLLNGARAFSARLANDLNALQFAASVPR